MLLGLGNAKILTFDSESSQVPFRTSMVLVSLRVAWGGGDCLKDDMILKQKLFQRVVTAEIAAQKTNVLVTAENPAPEEPLEAQTKRLVDCQHKDKTLSVKTVDLNVEVQHVLHNSLVDADRVRPIDYPAEGTNNNCAKSGDEGEIEARGMSTMPQRFRDLNQEAPDPPVRWPYFVGICFLFTPRNQE
ncbi:hypothetical protein AgCh_001678 [Apium graveolens]